VPEQQAEEAGEDSPQHCTGQREAPLILEIVKEEEVMRKDEEGGMRDSTKKIRSLQKRKKVMRKNMEKIRRKK